MSIEKMFADTQPNECGEVLFDGTDLTLIRDAHAVQQFAWADCEGELDEEAASALAKLLAAILPVVSRQYGIAEENFLEILDADPRVLHQFACLSVETIDVH